MEEAQGKCENYLEKGNVEITQKKPVGMKDIELVVCRCNIACCVASG